MRKVKNKRLKNMKLRCITINDQKQIPILDEVTIKDDNMLYLDNLKESNLNAKELFKDNKELDFLELEPYIYAISTKDSFFYGLDDSIKWDGTPSVYQNIKIFEKELWGDVVILKIINDNIYGLTNDEIDKYIKLIKTENI